MASNTLYYGDNLEILQRYVRDESVDLVYLDPPFNSNQTYNVLFQEKDGSQSASQIKAFEDTWQWDETAARAYQETVETGGSVAEIMIAFRKFLGTNDMLAYLSMMAPRLVELRRVLKPTGSLYLHCDPTASHYLKLLLDAVFGHGNFRNEVVWRIGWISGFKSQKRGWIRNHDTILYYVRSSAAHKRFNKEYIPYPPGYVRRDGKKPTGKGIPVEDTWNCSSGDVLDSIMIKSFSTEKLGYPTQKPVALLERIVKASSNPGEVVLDPFCGCGTTIAAAQKLGRHWIGIDITHLAISLIRHRLQDSFGKNCRFDVIGEPVSLQDAEVLAQQDPYQFQWWALGLAGARPIEQKKGADRGIDGRLYFHDEGRNGKTKQIIFSVKAGHVTVSQVRDLVGVITREKAQIGVFLSLNSPTAPMRREAASAGFYKSPWGNHPRIQLLTIEDLLDGKTVDYPQAADVTFKRAKRIKTGSSEKQNNLPMEPD